MYAEIIADGVHVSDEALKLFFKEDQMLIILGDISIGKNSNDWLMKCNPNKSSFSYFNISNIF